MNKTVRNTNKNTSHICTGGSRELSKYSPNFAFIDALFTELCLYGDNLSSLQTQERVSNIYPEDLMQIVSHMDSLDNHKVPRKGMEGKKETRKQPE